MRTSARRRLERFTIALAAVLGYMITIPASAQKSPAGPPAVAAAEKPMQIDIVRSAQPGCEPQCPEWIAAQGRIEPATLAQFKKVLARIGKRKLPILIDSVGGAVHESLEIGRLIRAKGLDVAVTKTKYQSCPPTDAMCRRLKSENIHLALPEARASLCASSCAFILAGGTRRYVGAWTRVGVHQIASFQTMTRVLRTYRVQTRYSWGVPVEKQKTLIDEKKVSQTTLPTNTSTATYEKVQKYFADMGIADNIMTLLLSAPNSSIRWLYHNDLTSTKMATDFVSGEVLVLGATAIPVEALEGIAQANFKLSPPQVGPSGCSTTRAIGVGCAPGVAPASATSASATSASATSVSATSASATSASADVPAAIPSAAAKVQATPPLEVMGVSASPSLITTPLGDVSDPGGANSGR